MATKKKLTVLSGAGISAESGIRTFRDSGGLWEGHDVMEVASPEGFKKDPGMVLDFYNQRRKNAIEAKPNEGHKQLVRLEKYFDVCVVTQNVDNLHERAGSSNVIHLHGELLKMRSTRFDELVYDIQGDIHLGDLCGKGFQLRPHIVWFGEAVPLMQTAFAKASACDIFIVVGTSLAVYPAASMIHFVADKAIKYIVDINLPWVDEYPNLKKIKAPASSGLKKVADELIEHFA